FAQVKFEAKVNKQTLALNEKLHVEFVLTCTNGVGDNFVPPSFDGFRVAAGPYLYTSIEIDNNRGKYVQTYSYFLIPTKRGNITLKPGMIEVAGKIYKTDPITIKVTEAVEHPRDPSDNSPPVQKRAEEALTLVAEISKTNPYVNEPITVVYKLY